MKRRPEWWLTLIERSRSPAGAVRAVATMTMLVTLASGALIHIIDNKEFPTLGSGLWWAAQTVTTVGYGDAVPEGIAGRIVAVYVMFTGIALLTVITAAVSAGLLAEARRRLPAQDELPAASLEEIAERLERIEEELRRQRAAA